MLFDARQFKATVSLLLLASCLGQEIFRECDRDYYYERSIGRRYADPNKDLRDRHRSLDENRQQYGSIKLNREEDNSNRLHDDNIDAFDDRRDRQMRQLNQLSEIRSNIELSHWRLDDVNRQEISMRINENREYRQEPESRRFPSHSKIVESRGEYENIIDPRTSDNRQEIREDSTVIESLIRERKVFTKSKFIDLEEIRQQQEISGDRADAKHIVYRQNINQRDDTRLPRLLAARRVELIRLGERDSQRNLDNENKRESVREERLEISRQLELRYERQHNVNKRLDASRVSRRSEGRLLEMKSEPDQLIDTLKRLDAREINRHLVENRESRRIDEHHPQRERESRHRRDENKPDYEERRETSKRSEENRDDRFSLREREVDRHQETLRRFDESQVRRHTNWNLNENRNSRLENQRSIDRESVPRRDTLKRLNGRGNRRDISSRLDESLGTRRSHIEKEQESEQ